MEFSIKTQAPFHLDQQDFKLQEGQVVSVPVHFQPESKNDKISGKINKSLIVSYKDHPQKDSIDLIGELYFPNLTFSHPKVDFGCILNNTIKKLSVTIKNEGNLLVKYKWSFLVKVSKVFKKKVRIFINDCLG